MAVVGSIRHLPPVTANTAPRPHFYQKALGGLGQLKVPAASPGIEPGTFRLPAQRLSQLTKRRDASQLSRHPPQVRGSTKAKEATAFLRFLRKAAGVISAVRQ
jgi:hypothetical protein